MLSLYVITLYGSNPRTFPSRIPSAILYLCNSSPNISEVVFIFFWFSSWIGVPVNPKNNALGKVSLIVINISPKVDLWHSSMINTILFEVILSKSDCFNPSFSFPILLIFCIEVTIKVLAGSSLFIFETNTCVSSVSWISSALSAKARYSFRDWVPNSILSIKKITLSASFDDAINWADLKLVNVFPDPVVCQI